MNSQFKYKSYWNYEKYSLVNGIYQLKQREIWTPNIFYDAGIEHALKVEFDGDGLAKITNWYVLIFNTDTTPAAGDTYTSPSFTEFTDYDETVRPTWTDGGVSSKSISNSANRATFTMSAGVNTTIYGGALVSNNTKGHTTATNYMSCGAKFSASIAVVATDVLKVTGTITGADG